MEIKISGISSELTKCKEILTAYEAEKNKKKKNIMIAEVRGRLEALSGIITNSKES